MIAVRIVWHSVHPGRDALHPTGSGYGTQSALWVPRIAALGHEVAVSAFWGQQGRVDEWEGHRVYPGGRDPYGADVLAKHARHFKADLVIHLGDVFCLDPEPWKDSGIPVAHWMPVDCDDGGGIIGRSGDVLERSIGLKDHLNLMQGGGVPIAMSRFGETQLKRSGHSPLFAPHGIDTTVYAPPADRDELRRMAGLDGRFVIGINAANNDKVRKAWPENLAAFAKFHRRHADAFLMIMTQDDEKNGLKLRRMARDMGIAKAVGWSDDYLIQSGQVGTEAVAAWYGALDLFSGCTLAEGFGLPVLEAQSAGVPTVVTDGSAMSEVGCGWKVQGEPYWSLAHAAWWRKPSIDGIARAYEDAYRRGTDYRAKAARARPHALAYDADAVLTQHWKPVLEQLEAGL
jgi:glycosyltransferase involved in cell wall biosynthesis